MWVIAQITNTNFEVGYYLYHKETDQHQWNGIFSYETLDDAALQCNYLNGGNGLLPGTRQQPKH
jgi:hypothetical protein